MKTIQAAVGCAGVALALGATLLAAPIALGQDKADPAAASVACPAKFDHFLRTYADSEAVQRKATVFPLPFQTLDLEAQPEPKPVMRHVRAREAIYPLLPLPEARKREGLEPTIERQTAKAAQVLLFKPDTGYHVIYYFARSQCWRLQRIEDWST